MTFLKTVFEDRQYLVEALRRHPGLRKVVEQCYPDNAHFIYELLQNAEDAGASEASFELQNDRLIFTHDGKRAFTEKDVWSITDYGESSLSGQIGKFGVGFKSVFAYSETPRIYCRTFSFEFVNLVQPRELTPNSAIGNQTRFEFPFNNPKRPRDRAFNEINRGLKELSDSTLLFLSNLHVIRWQINDGSQTTICRVERPNDQIQIDFAVRAETIKSTHWLRFSNKWVDQNQKEHSVAVAFSIAFTKYRNSFDETISLAEQFKIVAAPFGRVFVFFPAAGVNSGLYFHIQAPFATDVSRANVKDDTENGPLYERLKNLAVHSLHRIRDLGLLTKDFLAVLPNDEDDLPEDYRQIRVAILAEMNNKALTPARDGTFSPARELIHAKPELQDFLSKADLKLLLDTPGQDQEWNWAVDFGSGRQFQFLESLAVRKYGINEFQQQLIAAFQPCFTPARNAPNPIFAQWLSRQDSSWHQRLYAVLEQAPTSPDGSDPLSELSIVRLTNGNYAKGGDCYFSSTSVELPKPSKLKIVDKQVYSSGNEFGLQNRAKRFLDRIGVTEIQERDVIECDLKQRYSDPRNPPADDAIYRADLLRFMQFLKKTPLESPLFSTAYVLKTNREKWVTPNDVYLDDPFETTLLKAYYDCLGNHNGVRFPNEPSVRESLSTSYDTPEIPREKFIQFAKAVGVQSRLEIVDSACQNNPKWGSHLSLAKGKLTQGGHEQDFYIPNLERLLEGPSLDKSKLIWQTMCNYVKRRDVLKAERRMNASADPVTVASRLVAVLSSRKWIPQEIDGDRIEFVVPTAASRIKLPPGFHYDAGYDWLREIGFGDKRKQDTESDNQEAARNEELRQQRRDAANRLGFPPDTGELLAELAKSFPTADALKQALKQFVAAQLCSLPVNSPLNPERRRTLVAHDAGSAPERVSEQRRRAVSVGLSLVKEEAKEYLRRQYTNKDGVMTCQICGQKSNLFKYQPQDGPETYHFVAREFLGENEEQRRQYQNYLALCPNHAAMFKHANNSKHNLRRLFDNMPGLTLEIVLAKNPMTVTFTDTHWHDLRAILDR